MIYGSGLRASEAVRLQSYHIESNRMMLRVEQGKGRKDRYTVLSEKALELLRDYYRKYKPSKWLFSGKDKTKPMPVSTAQRIFYKAKERAGLTKVNGIHSLRHYVESDIMGRMAA
jgi:integrase/recombinase XerD